MDCAIHAQREDAGGRTIAGFQRGDKPQPVGLEAAEQRVAFNVTTDAEGMSRDLHSKAGGMTAKVGEGFGANPVGNNDAIAPGMVERRPCILIRQAFGNVAGAANACTKTFPKCQAHSSPADNQPSSTASTSSAANTFVPLSSLGR